MKSFFVELFSENGTISSMRAMAFLALGLGGFSSVYGMTQPNPDYSGIALLSGLCVGAALGGKVMQKRAEKVEQDKADAAAAEAATKENSPQ